MSIKVPKEFKFKTLEDFKELVEILNSPDTSISVIYKPSLVCIEIRATPLTDNQRVIRLYPNGTFIVEYENTDNYKP